MKTLKAYFNTIRFRTLGIFTFGFVILVLGLILWETTKNEPTPDYYVEYLVSLTSLCIAISSAFAIKYKEVPRPGLPSVRGTWAVIQGIIALLISGAAFIVLFYDATVKVLK